MTGEERYRRLLAEKLKDDDRLEVCLPYGVRKIFVDIVCRATGSCVSVRFMDGEMRFWDFVDDGRNDGFGVSMDGRGLETLTEKLYEVFSCGFRMTPYLCGERSKNYFEGLFPPDATDDRIVAEIQKGYADGWFGEYDRLEAVNCFGDRKFSIKLNG